MHIRSACAAVVAGMCATVLGAGAATADVTDTTGLLSGTKVRVWEDGSVLSVVNNSRKAGAEVHYMEDNEHLTQKWAIDPVTKNSFLLRNLHSNMCLTAVGGDSKETLVQRPCDPRFKHQIFSLLDSHFPHRYQLLNDQYLKCMAPYSSSTREARLTSCDGTAADLAHSFDVR